jgi:hypothetical protein
MNPAGLVLLILIRSVLLWILVPVAFVVWVFGGPWLWRKGPTNKFVRWADYNTTVTLMRTILRPLTKPPYSSWAPLSQVREFNTPISFINEFA